MIKLTKFSQVMILLGVLLIIIGLVRSVSMKSYEEECFEYKTIKFQHNFTYETFEPLGCEFLWCISCKCDLVEKVWFYNITETTDDCVKYHLVRYAD